MGRQLDRSLIPPCHAALELVERGDQSERRETTKHRARGDFELEGRELGADAEVRAPAIGQRWPITARGIIAGRAQDRKSVV